MSSSSPSPASGSPSRERTMKLLERLESSPYRTHFHQSHKVTAGVFDSPYSPVRVETLQSKESAEVEELHAREMIRIHEQLSATQRELASRERELEDVLAARRQTDLSRDIEFKNENSRLTREVHELREKLRFSEVQLQTAQQDKEHLTRSYETLSTTLAETQKLMDEQGEQMRAKAEQVQHLTDVLREINHEKQLELNQSTEDLRMTSDRLAEKDRIIESLQEKVRDLRESRSSELVEKEARIREVQATVYDRESILRDRDNEIHERDTEIADLRERLRVGERMQEALRTDIKRLEEHMQRQASEMAPTVQLQAENERLIINNGRLVKILASTAEFREFAAYMDDSKGASFVAPKGSNQQRRLQELEALMARGVAQDDIPVNPRDEPSYWVPDDAYKIGHDFFSSLYPAAGSELLNDFLITLNQVWRRRETRITKRLKVQFSDELKAVRRRWMHRLPYDNVIKSTKIEYLQRELRKAMQNARKRRLTEAEARLLESSLATVEALKRENSHLLSSSASSASGPAGSDTFLEGAAWASRSLGEVLDQTSKQVGRLTTDLQQRLLDVPTKAPDAQVQLIRLHTRFVEDLGKEMERQRQLVQQTSEHIVDASFVQ